VFREYPWLLPCLFSSAYNAVVATLALFFLDETYNVPIPSQVTTAHPVSSNLAGDEREPLLSASMGEDYREEPAYQGLDTVTNTLMSVASKKAGININFRQVQAMTLISSV